MGISEINDTFIITWVDDPKLDSDTELQEQFREKLKSANYVNRYQIVSRLFDRMNNLESQLFLINLASDLHQGRNFYSKTEIDPEASFVEHFIEHFSDDDIKEIRKTIYQLMK